MKDYTKKKLRYVVNMVLAMVRGGQHHDIYEIIYEPKDGRHHSETVKVYMDPKFEDIKNDEKIADTVNNEE